MIDTLRPAGAAGTFFAIGRDLEADPQIGRDIVAAGDELANHSYSHDRMVFRPMSFSVDEVERTDRLVTVSELLRAGHASGSCGITGRDCTAHG